jgi:hypothetical protein
MRGICPLDLAPELSKLQTFCVEELFKIAWLGHHVNHSAGGGAHGSPDTPHKVASHSNVIGTGGGGSNRPSLALPHWRFHASEGVNTRVSLVAPCHQFYYSWRLFREVIHRQSNCSMLDTPPVKDTARRKSLVSLQLHRKTVKPTRDCESAFTLIDACEVVGRTGVALQGGD